MSVTINELKSRLESVPREKLGFFPTPFYKLDRMSAELGIDLFIKRDDFTGMSLFGGNKVRKLEYLLGDARKAGAKYIFTYGATQSNHAMQTAAACRRLGFEPVLYLTAIVEPDEEDLRGNLLLDRIFGSEIKIIRMHPGESEAAAEERSFRAGAARIIEMEKEGKRCYDIPMGGSSFVGATGYIEAYAEMKIQADSAGIVPEYIIHSCGSGGTMAGLAAGKHVLGDSAKIISAAAFGHDDDFLSHCAKMANDALAYIGLKGSLASSDFELDHDYFAPGYEQPSAGGTEAVRMLAMTEGLLADPVYSGKALAALIDKVRSGEIPQGAKTVFWHTGGATALFAEKEILGEIY